MSKCSSAVFILLVIVGACWCCVLSSNEAIAANDSGSQVKQPLDLPNGKAADQEDEEDAPEIITFYGTEYEGDAFFWCLDRSGSMSFSGKMGVLQQEVIQALNSLSPRAEFGLVSFADDPPHVFSTQPMRATPANKSAGVSWVSQQFAGGGTCILPAALQTITISNLSSKHNKRMIFVSDGYPECSGETQGSDLTNITGANWQRTPIDTLFVMPSDPSGQSFMQSLAGMNSGSFTVAGQ